MFANDILKDKKILITGSYSGLGRTLACMCRDYGANVLISGRDLAKCQKCSNEIGIPFIHLDVTKFDTFQSKINETINKLGGLDILVNNAGYSSHGVGIMSENIERYDRQFDVNMKGPYFLTKAFMNYHLNVMKCDKIRKVLFTSSQATINGYNCVYPLTKVAIEAFSKNLADVYFKHKLRFNCVVPSGIGLVAMNNNGDPNKPNSCPFNLSGRSLSKESVSNLFIFLMSDLSNDISGANYAINEGKKNYNNWVPGL